MTVISNRFTLQAKARDGRDGASGKLCYIAGPYDPQREYTSDTLQTVAVEYEYNGVTEIWILTAATNVVNGVHYAPRDSAAYWSRGLNEENILRSKYLFADFAHFGSAIVSGDWLISANGTIDGVAYDSSVSGGVMSAAQFPANSGYPAYMWFESAHPGDDTNNVTRTVNGTTVTGHNFIPNYAVDLLTGRTYQGDAYVRGRIVAQSLKRRVARIDLSSLNYAASDVDANTGKTWQKFLPATVLGAVGGELPSILIISATISGNVKGSLNVHLPHASEHDGHQMDVYVQRSATVTDNNTGSTSYIPTIILHSSRYSMGTETDDGFSTIRGQHLASVYETVPWQGSNLSTAEVWKCSIISSDGCWLVCSLENANGSDNYILML